VDVFGMWCVRRGSRQGTCVRGVDGGAGAQATVFRSCVQSTRGGYADPFLFVLSLFSHRFSALQDQATADLST
jgi:hypothetical protein